MIIGSQTINSLTLKKFFVLPECSQYHEKALLAEMNARLENCLTNTKSVFTQLR
jgi:hypothetical protein